MYVSDIVSMPFVPILFQSHGDIGMCIICWRDVIYSIVSFLDNLIPIAHQGITYDYSLKDRENENKDGEGCRIQK